MLQPELQFLGVTPGAFICDDGETGLLEIKCPFTARDMAVTVAASVMYILVCLCLKKATVIWWCLLHLITVVRVNLPPGHTHAHKHTHTTNVFYQ